MPGPAIAVAGLGLASAGVQANAAKKAGAAQSQAAQAGIDEQRRQFDTIRALLEPYVANGRAGLSAQMGQLGLRGPREQQAAITGVLQGPEFSAMIQQGENAILQNASATGGLRGGNTQAALAQYRPQVLNQLLEQRYARLGGLATMGQNSAAGVGTAAQAMGNNVGQLLQQQGAAQAGASLARGQAFGNVLGGIGGLVGREFGTGFDGFNVGQPGSLFGGNSWGM